MAIFLTLNGILGSGGGGGGGIPTRSLSFEQLAQFSDGGNFATLNPRTFSSSCWVSNFEAGGVLAPYFQKNIGAGLVLGIGIAGAGMNTPRADFTTIGGFPAYSVPNSPSLPIRTSQWLHLYTIYDSTQASDTNRIQQFVDGTLITYATPAERGYPPQNTPVNVAGNAFFGRETVNQFGHPGGLLGLYYQPAFFSGILPTAAQLYNGGVPVNVLAFPGIYSALITNETDNIGYDVVRNVTWSNPSDRTVKSTTIPI